MKYLNIGSPFETESIVNYNDMIEVQSSNELNDDIKLQVSDVIKISYEMKRDDYIFGLGENTKGINKRGSIFESFCSDDPTHLPDRKSLYGAHNFFIVDGSDKKFGIYIDFPSKVTFDIGFTHKDHLEIIIDGTDVRIYYIDGATSKVIVSKFLKAIGKSYLPPKWAFGYQQSRWSYETSDVIREIATNMDENDIPCDAIYLDIDYMKDFKNFTIDQDRFPEFKSFVGEIKAKGFRLIPIIDAGCKIESGYDIYEEGITNNFFCLDENKEPFIGAVWPGTVHFPDFLNAQTRKWFGDRYSQLIDLGIDGFWNDMNEPAIFYSQAGIKSAIEYAAACKGKNLGVYEFFSLKDKFIGLSNKDSDYKSFYHNVDGKIYNHYDLHNLYGYNMTKSAGQAFEKNYPNKRILMFSRASYIGMHRYGGIWTGDNHAWWEHLLLNIKMMPSLNMCGFIYSGADVGGFGTHVESELLTRWNQFAIFTPLFRNHSAMGTRHQEPFRFDEDSINDVRNAIKLRYALVNFIYSEFMKHNNSYDMLFKPLSFEYDDQASKNVEDQLLYGESLMLTPIYSQNALGRYVYLPENMAMWKLKSTNDYELELYKAGHHFIDVALNEIPTFIRKNKLVVTTDSAKNVEKIDRSVINVIGYVDTEARYELYSDDGISRNTEPSKSTLSISVRIKNGKVEVHHESNKKTDIKEIHYDLLTKNNVREKGVYHVR